MRFVFGLIIAITLACSAVVANAQNYTLQPGDVISVEVIEDPSLNRNALVLPDGTINFPFAGSVRAGGRTVDQVQQSLTRALAPNFAAEPTVFASINQLATSPEEYGSITIYALGQVTSPGARVVDTGTTILQALSTVGGFTQFAARNRIQLRRIDPGTGNEAIFTFDLRAAGQGRAISGATTMQDGDVILVPERGLFE